MGDMPCVQVVKLNVNVHMQFTLELLAMYFGTYPHISHQDTLHILISHYIIPYHTSIWGRYPHRQCFIVCILFYVLFNECGIFFFNKLQKKAQVLSKINVPRIPKNCSRRPFRNIFWPVELNLRGIPARTDCSIEPKKEEEMIKP